MSLNNKKICRPLILPGLQIFSAYKDLIYSPSASDVRPADEVRISKKFGSKKSEVKEVFAPQKRIYLKKKRIFEPSPCREESTSQKPRQAQFPGAHSSVACGDLIIAVIGNTDSIMRTVDTSEIVRFLISKPS